MNEWQLAGEENSWNHKWKLDGERVTNQGKNGFGVSILMLKTIMSVLVYLTKGFTK